MVLATGCMGPRLGGREFACHQLQDNRSAIDRYGGRDLLELAIDTPAESDARSSYAQRLTATTLGALGAGALLAGLVSGFATDPATQPAARNAAYGLAGGAVGSFAVALLLAFTNKAPAERARHTLHWWSDHCP